MQDKMDDWNTPLVAAVMTFKPEWTEGTAIIRVGSSALNHDINTCSEPPLCSELAGIQLQYGATKCSWGHGIARGCARRYGGDNMTISDTIYPHGGACRTQRSADMHACMQATWKWSIYSSLMAVTLALRTTR
jgi:hypothetical protein